MFLSHQLIGAEEILKLYQAEKIKAKIYVFKVNLYHISLSAVVIFFVFSREFFKELILRYS